MASQSIASMHQLQKTLRSDGPRKSKGGDPSNMLNQVQVAASKRMHEISKKRVGSRPKRSDQDMAEMRVAGASEEDVREMAFQAREQMNFLQDVQTRVDNALGKSVDLLVEPEADPLNPQVSTLHPQPSTLNPQPSTLNPQPSTSQPSTLYPQPSTLNPQPSSMNINP